MSTGNRRSSIRVALNNSNSKQHPSANAFFDDEAKEKGSDADSSDQSSEDTESSDDISDDDDNDDNTDNICNDDDDSHDSDFTEGSVQIEIDDTDANTSLPQKPLKNTLVAKTTTPVLLAPGKLHRRPAVYNIIRVFNIPLYPLYTRLPVYIYTRTYLYIYFNIYIRLFIYPYIEANEKGGRTRKAGRPPGAANKKSRTDKTTEQEEEKLPGDKSFNIVNSFSLTISRTGKDVPLSLLQIIHNFITAHCESGGVALEVGTRKFQLHIQGIFSAHWPITKPYLIQLNKSIKNLLPDK